MKLSALKARNATIKVAETSELFTGRFQMSVAIEVGIPVPTATCASLLLIHTFFYSK